MTKEALQFHGLLHSTNQATDPALTNGLLRNCTVLSLLQQQTNKVFRTQVEKKAYSENPKPNP